MAASGPDPLGRAGLQRRAVQGALWTGVHTLVSLPVAFAVNILVARVLGVADYGRLAYLTTVIGIAGVIAGLGVTTALIQFGAKAHAAGDNEEVRRLLSGSLGFRLMVSGPIVAIAVLAIVRVEWWIMAIAIVFGVALPAILGNARPLLIIENRTDRSAQLAMVGNICIQASVVFAVLVLGTPDSVWSARTIMGGVLLVLPLAIASAHYRRASLRPALPWRLPRRFWHFALPTGLASVVAVLVSNRTEIILLDWFADERAMGLFGLAFGLAGHVYAPAQAFLGPLIPAVSALSVVDKGSVRRAFMRTSRAGSTIGGLLVVAVLPALALSVPLIYGNDFAAASDLLIVIGVGSAVMLIGSPHQAFLMARLGGKRLLIINLISLGVNLVLALLLIPTTGALGAAFACSIALIVRSLQMSFGEGRALGLPAVSVLRDSGGMWIAIGIATSIWLLIRQASLTPLVLAPIVALLGFVAYVLIVRVLGFGLTPGDAKAIRSALPGPIAAPVSSLLKMVTSSRHSMGDR